MMGRSLVIGDIHGQYQKLVSLLEHAEYSSDDRLIFLGDYIDRGPQSKEVLELLYELRQFPQHVFLRGNHEEIILHLASGDTNYLYMWFEYAEGRACLASYGIDPERLQTDGMDYLLDDGDKRLHLNDPQTTIQFIADLFPAEHLKFINSTDATFETADFFFSHAGIEKGVRLAAQKVYADCFLKWGDEEFLSDDTHYGKVIVFGHYHLKRPLIRPNKICIALEDDIAALDLTNMLLLTSAGQRSEVRLIYD